MASYAQVGDTGVGGFTDTLTSILGTGVKLAETGLQVYAATQAPKIAKKVSVQDQEANRAEAERILRDAKAAVEDRQLKEKRMGILTQYGIPALIAVAAIIALPALIRAFKS